VVWGAAEPGMEEAGANWTPISVTDLKGLAGLPMPADLLLWMCAIPPGSRELRDPGAC